MNKKYLGSAVVDYIVPTAVVGLVVGLGVYGLFESGNLTKFFAASGNISIENGVATINNFDNNNSALLNNTSLTKPILNGNNTNPNSSCISGSCEIDYGDFVLTGVPEDFDNFMESTASSGGTDLLADLLEIIAQNPELSNEQSDLIHQLANAGHALAADERTLEDDVLTEMELSLPIGFEQNIPLDLISYDSASLVSFQNLISQFNTLSAGNTDPNMKKVFNTVKTLTGEIIDIRRDLYNETIAITDLVNANASAFDIRNQMMGVANGFSADRTDIDSVFVCIAGSGTDGGDHCN